MKHFSSNIKPIAGILAIKNLNVFPASGDTDCLDYSQPWVDSFREAVRRSSVLAAEAVQNDEFGYDPSHFSLLELSIPRFAALGGGRYRLTGGLFLWAGHLFSPGATFRVQGNDFHIETPDLIEVATAVPVVMEELKYDTYNAAKLEEISDEVLKELDIELDKSNLMDSDSDDFDVDDPNWLNQVKYMSIYAETLTGGEPGRVVAYQKSQLHERMDYATPDLGFDASVFREIMDMWGDHYDQYWVEFVDTKQPFAYITIELIGPSVVKDNTDDMPIDDVFAKMFDASVSKDEFATHDKAEVVETLRKIAAGEL
jgi:hypothetical protein